MGHEGAGVVEELGPGVSGFEPGDHVVFAIRPMCGWCEYCSSGRPNLCNGITAPPGRRMDGKTRFHTLDGEPLLHGASTFSQYTVVPEWELVKVTDAVPIERLASLGCAVTTGVGAVVRTAQVQRGGDGGGLGLRRRGAERGAGGRDRRGEPDHRDRPGAPQAGVRDAVRGDRHDQRLGGRPRGGGAGVDRRRGGVRLRGDRQGADRPPGIRGDAAGRHGLRRGRAADRRARCRSRWCRCSSTGG